MRAKADPPLIQPRLMTRVLFPPKLAIFRSHHKIFSTYPLQYPPIDSARQGNLMAAQSGLPFPRRMENLYVKRLILISADKDQDFYRLRV
jgi:hypothetical protein